MSCAPLPRARKRGWTASLIALAVSFAAACSSDSDATPGAVVAGTEARASSDSPRVEPVGWSSYAGDPGSLRWSPLTELSPETVAGLQPVWEWRTEESARTNPGSEVRLVAGRFEATPLVIRDTMYVVTPFNRVVALDASTGRELWAFDPQATRLGRIANDHAGFVHRGLTAWEGPDGLRLLLASRTDLIALDAHTGQKIATFGEAGIVDLAADLRWPVNRENIAQTSPPALYDDVIIVGSSVGDGIIHERDPPGDVQAFDVRTGERLWRWDPVPALGDPARATWQDGSGDVTGHVNVWAPISVDTARGLVYLPVSTPSNDWYGGARLGDNLFAESLVCLEARTGRLVWYQQLVHHGLWDYDLAAPPVLVTMPRDSQDVDAVLVAAKTGYLYAYDRVSGEPLWPIAERAAPPSDVPGERAAESQPHPSWPLPFARQGFSLDDANDLTPALHAQALSRLQGMKLGPMFTPPSLEGTVVSPGWIGGAGWGATAVDPERKLFFVKSSNLPVFARLVPTGDARGYVIDSTAPPTTALMLRLRDYRTWYGARRAGPPVPIGKPPYGQLTAFDLATGEQRWQVPVGDLPAVRRHPDVRARGVGPLGVHGAPGPVVTAGGLLFLTGGGRTLYAVGADDGVTYWSHDLGAVGYSNPMTYRDASGTQFVVVATGAGANARLQAFARPHSAPSRP